jgi:hypothetical protein
MCGENAIHFLCTPKNLDVPPKMMVKGYMYPQIKKPVGMLTRWPPESILDSDWPIFENLI